MVCTVDDRERDFAQVNPRARSDEARV